MSSGENPYQNAALVVQLRNLLIHFKPQWQGDDAHSMEKKLRDKFPENQQVTACRVPRTVPESRADQSAHAG